MITHESLHHKLRSIVLAKAQAPFWPMVETKFARIFPDANERHEIGARIWSFVEERIIGELNADVSSALPKDGAPASSREIGPLKPHARKAVAAGVSCAMTQIERAYADFE